MPTAVINGSDQTSATSIVAAPGAGKKVVVYGLQVFSDTQDTLTFTVSGTDAVVYVAANGGAVLPPVDSTNRSYWEMEANTALTVTAGVAGNQTVVCQYEIEQA